MRTITILFCCIITLSSCNQQPDPNRLTVNVTVDGLRMGTLYLQQLQDSVIVNVDSVIIDGSEYAQLTTPITEPQIMYLFLDKNDGIPYNDRISFFAQDTIINIQTNLNRFDTDAVIKGSKNQELFQKYSEVQQQLNLQYTQIAKRSMQLQTQDILNTDSLQQLQDDMYKHIKRKAGYAINYAMLYKDYEMAPYALIKDADDINTIYLDSVYNMMPKKIQSSRYGKQLSELIKLRQQDL